MTRRLIRIVGLAACAAAVSLDSALAQGQAAQAAEAPKVGQNTSEQDKAAVRQAAYDYAEGFYEGAADRMERAVHPALSKRALLPASRTSPEVYLQRMNAETLIDATLRGIGKDRPSDQRNIRYELLDIRDDVASAKIFTAGFNDYLHLLKQDGQWRLVNVLWSVPRGDSAANAEGDRQAVAQVARDYYDALASFDALWLERTVHPEATLRTVAQNPGGKPFIIEGTRDSVVQQVRAKSVPPPAPVDVKVLDVYGNMGSALVTSDRTVSYWHLSKQSGQWRLVNRLTRPGPPAGQGQGSRPAILGTPMPDFTLPAIQGGEYGPSRLKGKNVLIVFPRGKVDDHWCQVCHYQYAELARLDATEHIRQKYNLEILFVLPYSEAVVRKWPEMFASQMAVIDGWKNPPNFDQLPANRKDGVMRVRRFFPATFDFGKGPAPVPFPILYDGDQAVSRMLGLYTTFWDGSAVDQNIPTVFLVDPSGEVRFRYTSATTVDRPNAAYLVKMMDTLIVKK